MKPSRRTLLRFGALAFAAPRSVVVPPYLTEWEQRQVLAASSRSYAPYPYDDICPLGGCECCQAMLESFLEE